MISRLYEYDRAPRILRLNIAGQPVEWVKWQDAVCLYARDLVVWTLGDPMLQVRGGHNRTSCETSVLNLHSIVACEGRVFARDHAAPPLTNSALFGRDNNTCLYCGKGFADAQLTRDHVVPVSRGGLNTWDNVVAACKRCNHFKGSRLLAETSLDLLALPYVPNYYEYLALTNSGRILCDQMDFLSKSFSSESRLRH